MSVEVRLPHFEGPLDLLLHLIQENQVDIYDIPIAEITDQYLRHLLQMKQLNLEVAGEFLLMAATLIYIKSKMLLPQLESEAEEKASPEDPRRELVERLVEYRTYKRAAEMLNEKEDCFQQQFTSCPQVLQAEPASLDPGMDLFQLLSTFYDLLSRTEAESCLVLAREPLDIHQSMVEILDRMGPERTITLIALFGGMRSRLRMIVSFLALLELVRQGILKVRQDGHLGEIWVYRAE